MRKEQRYIIPEWPTPPAIKCFSSTRVNGHSQQPFGSFNLATHVGDVHETVHKNREQLCQDWALQQPPKWLNQQHSTNCLNLDQDPDQDTRSIIADATTSRRHNTVCIVMTADCLPILLCNDTGTEVAAIHAGWRGLAAGIIDQTLQQCHSPTETLMAWLGPAISASEFTINADIKHCFTKKSPLYEKGFYQQHHDIKANLYELATINLKLLGVTRIFGGDHCTYNDEKRFFSYRRERKTGRMATAIWIS